MITNGHDPSFIEKTRALVSWPFDRAYESRAMSRARQAEAHALTLQYEAAGALYEQTVKRVVDDEKGWIPIDGEAGARQLGEDENVELREAAQKASYRDPHVIGYLRTLSRFVMGRGPQFVPDIDNEKLVAELDGWWAQFRRINDWDTLEDEIPWRLWRDGNVFSRRFRQLQDGPVTGLALSDDVRMFLGRHGISPAALLSRMPHIPRGMTHIRVVPDEEINDPEGKISHGIITSRSDVQTVIGYIWSPGGKVREVIPADEIQHIKIRGDSDMKRGRSILEAILKDAKRHDDWTNYRIALSLARSAIALIKKIEGAQTSSDVTGIRDASAVQNKSGQAANNRLQMLKPMTTVHAGPGITYEYLTPNLQAQDAQHDGRMLHLRMGAASGFPEYMISGDASNANFASHLVSESPAIREFESWQDFLAPHFRDTYRDVILGGVLAGQIKGLSEEDARELPVTIQFPPLEVRDALDRAKRNQVLVDGGILSKRGWAIDEGIDFDTEIERLEEELQADFDTRPPPVR